jgi:hypothetical protein
VSTSVSNGSSTSSSISVVLVAVVGVMYQDVLRENFQFHSMLSVKSCKNFSLKDSKIVRVVEGKVNMGIRG